jgi:hypothetical protein
MRIQRIQPECPKPGQIVIKPMKKLLFSAICTAIALTTFNATAASVSPAGPITVSWTVYQAGSNVTHSVTNHTATTTNILRTTTEKSKSFLFKNASLLALLENSFNTNFPAGSQLVYGDGPAGASIYLVDKTGSNIVFDISPVVSVTSSNGVQSGASSSTEKITATKTTSPGVAAALEPATRRLRTTILR